MNLNSMSADAVLYNMAFSPSKEKHVKDFITKYQKEIKDRKYADCYQSVMCASDNLVLAAGTIIDSTIDAIDKCEISATNSYMHNGSHVYMVHDGETKTIHKLTLSNKEILGFRITKEVSGEVCDLKKYVKDNNVSETTVMTIKCENDMLVKTMLAIKDAIMANKLFLPRAATVYDIFKTIKADMAKDKVFPYKFVIIA